MAHIKVKKGLDIPIVGKPQGDPKVLIISGAASQVKPTHIALDLQPFDDTKFKLLVKVGDVVKIGQPLAEDKASPGRMFCSPAAGTVSEVRRGLKRVLLAIIIEVSKGEEEYFAFDKLSVENASREQIIDLLKASGVFACIHSRPFNLLADPAKTPRSIFVKAVESGLFVPPAEMQVQGHEKEFQVGLNALAKLTDGAVHLVYRTGSTLKAFTEAQNVQKHTVEGPHPAGNVSLHIQNIDPIKSPEDVVWTLNAHQVVEIGHLLLHGRVFVDRVISIAGPGVVPDRIGYFKGRAGLPVSTLISGRIERGPPLRFISGVVMIKISRMPANISTVRG